MKVFLFLDIKTVRRTIPVSRLLYQLYHYFKRNHCTNLGLSGFVVGDWIFPLSRILYLLVSLTTGDQYMKRSKRLHTGSHFDLFCRRWIDDLYLWLEESFVLLLREQSIFSSVSIFPVRGKYLIPQVFFPVWWTTARVLFVRIVSTRFSRGPRTYWRRQTETGPP